MSQIAGSLRIDGPDSDEDEQLGFEYYDRVVVGPSMEAALPDATGYSISLLSWRVGDGPWLSPIDGVPVDPQPDWGFTDRGVGGFALVLQVAGESVRIQEALIFDRRTTVRVASSFNWGELEWSDGVTFVEFMGTELRHRADLLVTLPVTYGAAQVGELALTQGAVQRFGEDATARLLALVNARILSSSVVSEFMVQWDPHAEPSASSHAAIAIAPEGLDAKFQFRVNREAGWTEPLNSSGPIWLSGIPAAAKTIELRYLPYAARLQFSLPPPANLPVVDDLLETELGDQTFSSYAPLLYLLASCLQLDPQIPSELRFDRLRYPFTLKDATPKALIDYVQNHGVPALAIDTEAFAFETPRRPIAQRLKAWSAALLRRLGL